MLKKAWICAIIVRCLSWSWGCVEDKRKSAKATLWASVRTRLRPHLWSQWCFRKLIAPCRLFSPWIVSPAQRLWFSVLFFVPAKFHTVATENRNPLRIEQRGFLSSFFSSFSSPIWLIPLVDDRRQSTYLTKMSNKPCSWLEDLVPI